MYCAKLRKEKKNYFKSCGLCPCEGQSLKEKNMK